MLYFKFINTAINPSNKVLKGNNGGFMNGILEKILPKILPKANPDFDNLYYKVKTWYIEYNDEDQFTNREIGTDDKDNVIVKAPWKRNLGFWVDGSLKYNDYLIFDITPISAVEFDSLWARNNC